MRRQRNQDTSVADGYGAPRLVLQHHVVPDDCGHQVSRCRLIEHPMPLDAVADGPRSSQAAVGERTLALARPDIKLPRGLVVREIVSRDPEVVVFRLALCPDDAFGGPEVRSL